MNKNDSCFMIFVCIVLSLILASLIFAYREAPRVHPEVTNNWIEVQCDNCNGKGTVHYSKNHPIVKSGLGEADTAYTCPVCGGEKVLFLEKQSGAL